MIHTVLIDENVAERAASPGHIRNFLKPETKNRGTYFRNSRFQMSRLPRNDAPPRPPFLRTAADVTPVPLQMFASAAEAPRPAAARLPLSAGEREEEGPGGLRRGLEV